MHCIFHLFVNWLNQISIQAELCLVDIKQPYHCRWGVELQCSMAHSVMAAITKKKCVLYFLCLSVITNNSIYVFSVSFSDY